MNPDNLITVVPAISLLIVVLGWFVNSWLNRRHEIAKMRYEKRMNALEAVIGVGKEIHKRNINADLITKAQVDLLVYGYRDEIALMNEIVGVINELGGQQPSETQQKKLIGKNNELMTLIRERIRDQLHLSKVDVTEDKLKVHKYIFKNSILGLFLGGVPCTLLAVLEGVPALLRYFEGLVPPSTILYYLTGAYIVSLGLSGMAVLANKYSIRGLETIMSAYTCVARVSNALKGILLLISGGLFVVLPPILFTSSELMDWANVIYGVAFGIGALYAASFMEAVDDKLRAKRARPLTKA